MKSQKIKDIMVPISDYATINEDASMVDAIRAIESEKKRYKTGPYRHHSVIVIDDNRHVVGRLSQVDIMRALEPRYSKLEDAHWMERSVLSKKVLATIRESFRLWEQPLDKLFKALMNENVLDYLQKPTEGEFVSDTDTLNIAVHRIIMGLHHSLLVTHNEEIVGILRSTDLFNFLYDKMHDYGYL